MRFYNQQHQFYCGARLHARSMYLCILDQPGNVVFDKNLEAAPAAFLDRRPWQLPWKPLRPSPRSALCTRKRAVEPTL